MTIKTLYKDMKRNWKTSMIAFFLLASFVCAMFDILSENVFVSLIGALSIIGFSLSKDGDVTHTTEHPSETEKGAE